MQVMGEPRAAMHRNKTLIELRRPVIAQGRWTGERESIGNCATMDEGPRYVPMLSAQLRSAAKPHAASLTGGQCSRWGKITKPIANVPAVRGLMHGHEGLCLRYSKFHERSTCK